MGLSHMIGRVILVVINLILLIISLTLIVFGFLVKFSGSTFDKFTKPVIDKISSSVKDAFSDTDFTADSFNLSELFGSIATVLIIVGFVLLIISVFGSCGACCDQKCMLMSYALILLVLVIAQIVFVVFLLRYPEVLKKAMKKPMKTLLKNYQGLNGTNVESLAWNFAMQEFQCCGLDGSGDFKNGDSSWFGEDDTDWKTPAACCKTLPTTGDFACAKTNGENSVYNNYNKGCIDEIWKILIEDNELYAYIGSVGVLVFQVLLIVFALILYYQDSKKVAPSGEDNRRNRSRNNRGDW